jgi:hypothetical protein
VKILLTPDNSLSGPELRIRTRLLGNKNGDTTTEGSNFKEYNKKPEVSYDDKKTAAKNFLKFFFDNPINVSDVAKLLQPIKQDAAPTYAAAADDTPTYAAAAADDTPTYAAAADDTHTYAEYDNPIINISSDKQKTRQLIQALRDNILTIDDPNKIEVISMLESTPEMLEFIGENLVLVHSYHSRTSQFVTKDEEICDKPRKVVNFLQKYYTSKQIRKEVSLTNKLKTKCSRSVSPTKLMSPDELMSDDIQPKKIVLTNVFDVLGGSKSRHIRRHKHNRKSHRKHPRKTRRGRGRTHKSKSKSKRQILARKYKKNTYKRCT